MPISRQIKIQGVTTKERKLMNLIQEEGVSLNQLALYKLAL